MSDIIAASALEVGDVFYIPRRSDLVLRRVHNIRTVTFLESYRIVEYLRVNSPYLQGQMDLRADIQVARVRQLGTDEALMELSALAPGEDAHFWRVEGEGFYA